MGRDPSQYNQSLHCQFHQAHGYTTEDCRTLRDFLEQLVKARKLKQFLFQPSAQGIQAGPVPQQENYLRPSLGTINVILAALCRAGIYQSKVMSVSNSHGEDLIPDRF